LIDSTPRNQLAMRGESPAPAALRPPVPIGLKAGVGPRAGLDEVVKRRNIRAGNRTPVVQAVITHYTDRAIMRPCCAPVWIFSDKSEAFVLK
jgi:hypothetical protein